MVIILLAILGACGALVDISLHFLQLWPQFEPSRKFTSWLTCGAGFLMMLSCVSAFNWAALVMGLGIAGMAIFSLVTGKELD